MVWIIEFNNTKKLTGESKQYFPVQAIAEVEAELRKKNPKVLKFVCTNITKKDKALANK